MKIVSFGSEEMSLLFLDRWKATKARAVGEDATQKAKDVLVGTGTREVRCWPTGRW